MRIFFLLISALALGQTNPAAPIHYPKPSGVYEFQRFGDIGVSEYRGLADISVPIYNVSAGDVNIPIQANYYSGGIKVNEEAGLIGLGWNMSFPVVVQEINGYADFGSEYKYKKLPPFQGNPAYVHDAQYPFYMWGGSYNTNVATYAGYSGYQTIPYLALVHDAVLVDHNGYFNTNQKYKNMLNWYDTEPDMYSVTLNGVTVKFTIAQSTDSNIDIGGVNVHTFKIINGRTEYKIEYIPKSPTNTTDLSIDGIRITDPSGTIYTFSTIEIAGSLSAVNASTILYKIKNILTTEGKQINFNYHNILDVREIPKMSVSYKRNFGPPSMQYDPSHMTSREYYTGQFSPSAPEYCFSGTDQAGGLVTSNLVYTNYQQLNQITTENEIIDFSYSTRIDYQNMVKLDFITIKNYLNQQIKKVNFIYDYFISANSGNGYLFNGNPSFGIVDIQTKLKNRLKLVSIKEEGQNPYFFEYNSTILPKKSSYSYDYWGFYNGHNNTTPYPNLGHLNLGYVQYNDNSQNNFGSNINFTKACSLEKIFYPTGGRTEFDYSTHQFDNLLLFQGSNTPIINHGGGLRVNSITNFDHVGNQTSKSLFLYEEGKVISKRVFLKQSLARCFDFGILRRYTSSGVSFNSNNFLNETTDSNGNYIGYSKVTIKNLDQNLQSNGKIEKYFTNNLNNCIDVTGNHFLQLMYYTNRNDLVNGLLLSEKIYNAYNDIQLEYNTGYINKSFNENMYAMRKNSAGYSMWIYWTANEFIPHISPSHLLTFYPIHSKTSFKTSEVTVEHFENSTITNSTYYTYDTKNNINEIKTYGPGDVLTEQPKTSKTIHYSYSITPNSTTHTQKNIYNMPSRIIEQIKGVTKNEVNILYEDIGSVTRIKDVTSIQNNITSTSKKMFYDLYDDKSNLLQYHNENDVNVSVIWGYNKTLPVVKLENIAYNSIPSNIINSIQLASNSNNGVDLESAFESLRAALPNAFITTYTHKPLVGVLTIEDAKRDKIYYEYDSYNRLKFIRDKNGNILSENSYHNIIQN